MDKVNGIDLVFKKIPETTHKALIDGDEVIPFAGPDGTFYYITRDELFSQMGGITSGFIGPLFISDTPTEDGMYIAAESGTYTNAGSIPVDLQNGVTFIVRTEGAYSEIVIPFDMDGYVSQAQFNTVYPTTVKSESGANKLDINDPNFLENSAIISNATIEASATFSVTGFIPIEDGQVLSAYSTTADTTAKSFLYDENLKPILGSAANAVDNIRVTLTGTSESKFARFSIRNNTPYYIVFEGTAIPEYVPYTDIPGSMVNDRTITEDKIAAGAVGVTTAPTLLPKFGSSNLIDPNDPNYLLGRYINASGAVLSSATYDVTGFIPIAEGEIIYANTQAGAYSGLYDSKLNPIPGSFIQATGVSVSVTGTEQSRFVRFSVRKTRYPVAYSGGPYVPESYRQTMPDNEFNPLKLQYRRSIMHSGTYGGADAVYKVTDHRGKFRLKFDFRINFNANDEANDVPLVRFSDSFYLNLSKALPILQTETASGTVPAHYQQNVGFSSGFKLGSTNAVWATPRRYPLVGTDAFCIWLRDVATGGDREAYLSSNQDLCMGIINDVFTIYRDGVGADGAVFNGGATSTLFTLPLKDGGGAWKTMLGFYEELQTAMLAAPALGGFILDFESIAEDKTTQDLLQFEKVKMVVYTTQQDTPGSTATSMHYDSFPLHFPYWKDENIHTCEIVSSGARVWASIDGNTVSDTHIQYVHDDLYIGGDDNGASGFEILNLEINRGDWGDAEVLTTTDGNTNNQIISDANPYILGLCGHVTEDQPEPSTNLSYQSLPRLIRTIELLRAKGYYFASAEDIWEWKKCGKKLPKRTAFIMLDDFNIPNLIDNRHIRAAVLKAGGKLNVCNIFDRYPTDPAEKDAYRKKVLQLRLQGWGVVSHSTNHDVRFAWKSSLQLEVEAENIMTNSDDMGEDGRIVVYPFGVPLTNMQKMMEYKGVAMGIDTRTVRSSDATWATAISREAMQQVTPIGDLKGWII